MVTNLNIYLWISFFIIIIFQFSLIIFLFKRYKSVQIAVKNLQIEVGNLLLFKSLIAEIFKKEIESYLKKLIDKYYVKENEYFNSYRNMRSGGTASSPLSDIRLKQDISYNLDEYNIDALKPAKFRYVEDNPYGLDSSLRYGFIAQDLEKVLPIAVKKNPDGYLCIDYNCIIAILVKTVKDLKKEIEILKENKVKRV